MTSGRVARKKRMQMRRERASINIQKNLRRLQARRSYDNVKASAIIMQTGMRAMSARIEFRCRVQSKAARIIQAYWRGYIAFTYYKNLRRATHFMQCRWKRQKGLRFSNWPPEPEKEQNMESEENGVPETDALPDKESEVGTRELSLNECVTAEKTIEEACSIIEEQTSEDVDKIKALTAENKNLKALLQEQKQRADDLERKYAEAHESSEIRRKKLKETEKRVKKLQVSLKRMIYSMSDQFSELKTILRTSSNSSSTSGQVAKDDQVDTTSNNSDDSSTDSDITSPGQAPTPVNISTLSSDALQVMVQDITGVDLSGTEKRNGEKVGAFDDFF